MSDYSAGYISIVHGNNVLKGFGTNFLNYVKVGDTITLDSVIYYVATIEDRGSLTLNANYTGPSITEAAYIIDIAIPPGQFYVFNTSTLAWDATTPTPTIIGLVVALGLKSIRLNWSVLDAVYGDLGYHTEIWHSLTNSFGSAELLSTQITTTFEQTSLDVVPHYYWLRAVQPDYSITGATLATGAQTPVAVQTKDIEPSAVTVQSYYYNNGPVVGSGSIGLIFGLGIDNTSNPNPMVAYISVDAETLYSAGVKDSQWKILDLTNYPTITTIRETSLIHTEVPLVSIGALTQIPANTNAAFAVLWLGEDSTVSVINASVNAIGLKK